VDIGRRFLACLLCSMWAGAAARAAEIDVSRPDLGGPVAVRLGLYLADVYEISGADQAFSADVVLLAEWRDPRLASTGPGVRGMDLNDVWNPRLQLVNQRGVNAMMPQRVEVDSSGLVRYRQRWWGRFSARMDLQKFPKDRHEFQIQVATLGYPRAQVELVPLAEKSGRASGLSIADWEIGPARAEAADFLPAPGAPALAGVRLVWEGRRHVGYYIAQVALPLALIVLMGWTALWVDPLVVTTRMSVAVTTMLTLIAYRFAFGRQVPALNYLTRLDYFMLGATMLVFLMLLVVAAGAWLVGKDRKILVDKIDRWSRAIFLALFAAVFLWSWLA
jgi:Neurotransmitter-gated ion-channel ligand binding domain